MALISEITSTQWTFDINNPGQIVQGLDSIKQCVFVILTTEPGTDPLRADFGCGAFTYVDMPVAFAVPKMVKEISTALAKWEPRIEQVKVQQNLNVSQCTFTVSYLIKNTKTTDQLNITYGNASNTGIL